MIERILEPEVMDSDRDAREYDAMDHAAVNAAFVADLIEALCEQTGGSLSLDPSHPSVTILDLGAGTGQIPIELCRRVPNVRVVAVDAAESMLVVARENVAAAGLVNRIELVLADAKGLPFPDAAFPVVISNSIVHHIAQPAGVLAESVRLTVAGGLLFHRDLCRPRDEAELKRLVTTCAGDATPYQRKLFSDSLRAAVSVTEMQRLILPLGYAANTVEMTSNRHWTWAASKLL